jgi:hypothetical protein
VSAAADLAEAIKDALNGETFGMDFDAAAVRVYLPRVELEQLGDGLSVKVVAKADDRQLLARGGSVMRDIPVDIGVQKRLTTGTDPDTEAANTQLDALVGFVEELADYLRPGTVYTVAAGRGIIVRTTIDPFYVPEHLTQYSVFTSAVAVTLRLL